MFMTPINIKISGINKGVPCKYSFEAIDSSVNASIYPFTGMVQQSDYTNIGTINTVFQFCPDATCSSTANLPITKTGRSQQTPDNPFSLIKLNISPLQPYSPNYANFRNHAEWPHGADMTLEFSNLSDIAIPNVTDIGTNGGPSAYGTYDQAGQVYEWTDSQVIESGTKKILRGGSWADTNPYKLSKYYYQELDINKSFRDGGIGFRLASYTDPDSTGIDQYVLVDHSGNLADKTFDHSAKRYHPRSCEIGAVNYNYYIHRNLITNQDYVAYLNEIDPSGLNTYQTYDSRMSVLPRASMALRPCATIGQRYVCLPHMLLKPVSYITWKQAAMYANWKHNTAGKIRQIYDPIELLLTSPTGTDAQVGLIQTNITLVPGDFLHVKTTGEIIGISDEIIGPDGINYNKYFANYDNKAIIPGDDTLTAGVTTVGTNGGPSFYGTYDQGGNVSEWADNQPFRASPSQGYDFETRPIMGGNYASSLAELSSETNREQPIQNLVREGSSSIGLRLVSMVPMSNFSEWVRVGDVDNMGDVVVNAFDGMTRGSVSYEYYIQKFPVTNLEYTTFLNQILPNDSDIYYDASTMTSISNRGFVENNYYVVTQPRDNKANYNPGSVAAASGITDVGTNGGPSSYGTYDQSGNVYEICTSGNNILVVGGNTHSASSGLARTSYINVTTDYSGVVAGQTFGPTGFRLIAIPDSGTLGIHPAISGFSSFVPVGDAGNVDSSGIGQVDSNFYIQEHTVTNTEYCAFLNAVASTDTYGLYDTARQTNASNLAYSDILGQGGISRSGASGSYVYTVKANMGQKPVVYVSWFNAARMANWIHHGRGSGSTETGAYEIPSGNMSGTIVSKQSSARCYIPTRDQWNKAAYYQKGSLDNEYWLYATQNNSAPNPIVASATHVGIGALPKGVLEDKPVTNITWRMGAAIANWINNGLKYRQPITLGSYDLDTNNNDMAGLDRIPNQTCYIPLVDEWYKAAYFQALPRPTYFTYPTQIDDGLMSISADINGDGIAVWNTYKIQSSINNNAAIGRIGPTGEVFRVGYDYVEPVTVSGTLYLGRNSNPSIETRERGSFVFFTEKNSSMSTNSTLNSGAYDLSLAEGEAITRSNTARYFLPSENEWYKAAYHNKNRRYWRYPTQTDVHPSPVLADVSGKGIHNIECSDTIDYTFSVLCSGCLPTDSLSVSTKTQCPVVKIVDATADTAINKLTMSTTTLSTDIKVIASSLEIGASYEYVLTSTASNWAANVSPIIGSFKADSTSETLFHRFSICPSFNSCYAYNLPAISPEQSPSKIYNNLVITVTKLQAPLCSSAGASVMITATPPTLAVSAPVVTFKTPAGTPATIVLPSGCCTQYVPLIVEVSAAIPGEAYDYVFSSPSQGATFLPQGGTVYFNKTAGTGRITSIGRLNYATSNALVKIQLIHQLSRTTSVDFISLKCDWPCGTAFPAVGVVYAMEAPNTIGLEQASILQDPSPPTSIITTNTSGSSDI